MADLEHIMRTTFSSREFTDQAVTDADVAEILDLARFASSGGNGQGWRVVAIRAAETKQAVLDASMPIARRYVAGRAAGEQPFTDLAQSTVTDADVEAVTPEASAWYTVLAQAPVLLVIGIDRRKMAAVDIGLDRVGIAGGGSIYPFVQNILLAARARGMSGVLTTFASGAEPAVQSIVGFPPEVAVAAMVPIGYPVKTITKLRRKPVEEFARWEHMDGAPITAP
ncbi:MAG: nitroreductase [Jatrophihabitantaceae bacterium]|nr:nitroreductase [Jatrophihabitantaceae bacterium]